MDTKPQNFNAIENDDKLLLSLIDAAPTTAFVWGLTEGWPVLYVSKGIEAFGYSIEELLNQSTKFEEIIHPDDLMQVEQEVSDAMASGAMKLEQQYRLITRVGSTRWVKDWTEFVRDDQGIATLAKGILLDNTDFVIAEERARYYARFPLENPNPVLRIDCFGDILLTNRAAQTMIENLAEGPPEQRDEWKRMMAQAADMQLSGRFDLNVGDKIFEFNIQHISSKEYTNLYGDDVTDLRRHENRMIDVAENLPGALFQYTLKPDGTDEVEFISSGCESIWEIPRVVIRQDPAALWKMIHPHDIADLRASVEASAKDFTVWRQEWRIIPASGQIKWLRAIGRPHLQSNGNIVWNTIALDVTQEKVSAKALSDALKQAIHVLSAALETRDPYTAGHEQRVAEISHLIGVGMNLDAHQLTGLDLAATVHDVGKIQIPAEILSKPTRLSAEEYALIKLHPTVGANLLADIEFEWPIADMIRQHHERFDGSGYPDGLSGESILLEARIIAVADTLEAMASHRPYRPGLGIEKAAEEIRDGAGTRYDPDVAKVCLDLIDSGAIQI